jgi:hypothetical protein
VQSQGRPQCVVAAWNHPVSTQKLRHSAFVTGRGKGSCPAAPRRRGRPLVSHKRQSGQATQLRDAGMLVPCFSIESCRLAAKPPAEPCNAARTCLQS